MGEVIDAAAWLHEQQEGKSRAAFDGWAVDRSAWRINLCTDGRVYVELIGFGQVVAQVALTQADVETLRSDLATMSRAQRDLLAKRRGAHLWFGRPHPSKSGWLMVKHNDEDVPFRPITCQKRRNARYPMPRCDACSKSFEVGEVAFQADRSFNWAGRPRICKGCAQPERAGPLEVAGGG